uniref:NADH dehydrogenase (ubiquinone) complex I, assembly factor 6 n=1 Tax=Strigamia maritima TaxID=126957 RepID=T1IUF8_STRMM
MANYCRRLNSSFIINQRYSLICSIKHVSTSFQPKNATEYCMDLVRRYDFENFLCSLLLPSNIRSTAFAIRAFNIEIAQVRDVVTNRDIGRMRMQFWRDALENIYKDNPPQQPVALELHRVLRKDKLTKRWFNRMIDCRETYLNDRGFENVQLMEDYGENSVASVHYLILESAGIKNIHADHVASHLGKSQGIMVTIRGTPFNVSRNRVYLPMDLMIKHGVSQEDILRRKSDQKVKDLVYDIACVANQHLKLARSFKKELPKESRVIFLPAIACHSYLRQLETYQFDIFHPHLQRRNSWLPFSLFWNKFRRHF